MSLYEANFLDILVELKKAHTFSLVTIPDGDKM